MPSLQRPDDLHNSGNECHPSCPFVAKPCLFILFQWMTSGWLHLRSSLLHIGQNVPGSPYSCAGPMWVPNRRPNLVGAAACRPSGAPYRMSHNGLTHNGLTHALRDFQRSVAIWRNKIFDLHCIFSASLRRCQSDRLSTSAPALGPLPR